MIEEVIIRNNIKAPVWSLTRNKGFVKQEKRFAERVASENTSNYKLVLPNNFAYDPIRPIKGSFNFNASENTGCISPIYLTFRVKRVEKIIPQYLFCLFQSEQFINQAQTYSFGTARPSLSFESFCKIIVPVPPLNDQEKVIEELARIKNLIKNAEESIKLLNNRLSLSLSLSLMGKQQLKNWERLPPLNMDTLPPLLTMESLDILELRI